MRWVELGGEVGGAGSWQTVPHLLAKPLYVLIKADTCGEAFISLTITSGVLLLQWVSIPSAVHSCFAKATPV